MITPATFAIDASFGPFAGFHDASIVWNGWACPFFPLESAQKVVAAMNAAGGDDTLAYDAGRDAFIETNAAYPDEPQVYAATTITVAGVEHKAYAIGAYGWCWDAYEGAGEPEVPPCPQCDGEGLLLGHLGTLAHYRCRACGWGWSS